MKTDKNILPFSFLGEGANKVAIEHKFQDIDLTNEEILSREFDNCFFINCNFSESKFSHCKFYECRFVNCNLSLAKVNGCSFFDTSFEDSKLIGLNWTEAAWPTIKLSNPLKFYKCVLNDTSFFGLCLREISMTECQAHDVDFRETDCTDADFTQTDFENSLFGKTNLTRADFTDAINYNIDIFLNEIKKAKFSLPEATSLLNCLDIQLTL